VAGPFFLSAGLSVHHDNWSPWDYYPRMSKGVRKKAYKDMDVLVIDDDLYILRAIELILRDMGIVNVEITRDPTNALAMIHDSFIVQRPFDFAICDWMMPEMSGIDLLRAVRKHEYELPFIMLTAKRTEDAVNEAKGLDVDAYLAKPFTQDQVRRKVATIANRVLSDQS